MYTLHDTLHAKIMVFSISDIIREVLDTHQVADTMMHSDILDTESFVLLLPGRTYSV